MIKYNVETNNTLSLYDPTHTLTLRNQFSTKINNKFNFLSKNIEKALRVLINNESVEFINDEYIFVNLNEYARAVDKIEYFMDWLKILEKKVFLSFSNSLFGFRGNVEFWFDPFIIKSYIRGIQRGVLELNKINIKKEINIDEVNQYIIQNIKHKNHIEILLTLSINEINGILDAMNQNISRILANTFANNKTYNDIKHDIRNKIEGIGLKRIRMMSRFFIIKAYNFSAINEYFMSGIKKVKTIPEHIFKNKDTIMNNLNITKDDLHSCKKCEEISKKVIKIEEIYDMIPFHPGCKCFVVPYIGG